MAASFDEPEHKPAGIVTSVLKKVTASLALVPTGSEKLSFADENFS